MDGAVAAAARCPVCDALAPTTRFTQGPARIVQCAACGLVYTDPLVSGQTYGAMRRPDWFAEARAAAVARMNVFLARVRAIDALNAEGARWRILDVGCGMGGFLCAAAAYGYDAYGVEPAAEQAAWAQGLHLNVRETADVDAFRPLRFQVATLWDVLEHIPRPIAMLESVRTVLEPGGVLFLSVPNGPHALWKAKLRRYVRGTGADVLGIGEHVVHYSAATLKMVLTRAGYERIDVRGGPVGVFDGSLRLLKRAGMEALTAAGDLVGTPLGATLLAVARRPDGPDRLHGAVRT